MRELVGVYDARGGLLGEAAYVWGRLHGTRHCALCDITHSSVRRKPAWDGLVERLGLRFVLLHLNELPGDVGAVVRETGAPVVLARTDHEVFALLSAHQLDQASGSIDLFERALRDRLSRL